MTLLDQPYAPRGPQQARLAGVAMIYQELNLAPHLSVEDNILLGQERRRLGLLDRQRRPSNRAASVGTVGAWRSRFATRRSKTCRSACSKSSKSPGRWPRKPKCIVFDEPTSSLARHDVERLFETIRKLRSEGLAIIYISHFLEEIRQICDRYFVLRDGETVGSGEVAGTTDAQIVSLMVGRSVVGIVSARAASAGRSRFCRSNV